MSSTNDSIPSSGERAGSLVSVESQRGKQTVTELIRRFTLTRAGLETSIGDDPMTDEDANPSQCRCYCNADAALRGA